MDRYERTLNVVTALNSFNNGELEDYNLLSSVCEYFDFIKDEELDDGDKRFLMHLSNKAGIPHYYDILPNFNQKNSLQINDENIGLSTISALLYESTLYTDDNSKLHQYQKGHVCHRPKDVQFPSVGYHKNFLRRPLRIQ